MEMHIGAYASQPVTQQMRPGMSTYPCPENRSYYIRLGAKGERIDLEISITISIRKTAVIP